MGMGGGGVYRFLFFDGHFFYFCSLVRLFGHLSCFGISSGKHRYDVLHRVVEWVLNVDRWCVPAFFFRVAPCCMILEAAVVNTNISRTYVLVV